jgi:DNA-binding beta-propeller fold protein YncE
MWVGNYYDRTLQVLDREAGAVVVSIDVGDQPRNMLLAVNHLWVISDGEKAVEQLNLRTLDVVSSVQIDGRPMALVSTGGQLWAADFLNDRIVRVADFIGGNVQLIEPAAEEEQSVLVEISVGDGPRDLAWDGAGIWVANYLGDSLMRVNPQNPEETVVISAVGDGPIRLIYDEGGLWVAIWNDREVIHLNLETGEQDVVISLDGRPTDIAWDGEFLWVLVGELDRLMKFNGESGDLVSGPIAVGDEPRDLLLTTDALWVACQKGSSLQRFDRGTGEITLEIPVQDDPIFMTAVDGDIWVIAQTANSIQKVDGEIISLLELAAQANGE